MGTRLSQWNSLYWHPFFKFILRATVLRIVSPAIPTTMVPWPTSLGGTVAFKGGEVTTNHLLKTRARNNKLSKALEI